MKHNNIKISVQTPYKAYTNIILFRFHHSPRTNFPTIKEFVLLINYYNIKRDYIAKFKKIFKTNRFFIILQATLGISKINNQCIIFEKIFSSNH